MKKTGTDLFIPIEGKGFFQTPPDCHNTMPDGFTLPSSTFSPYASYDLLEFIHPSPGAKSFELKDNPAAISAAEEMPDYTVEYDTDDQLVGSLRNVTRIIQTAASVSSNMDELAIAVSALIVTIVSATLTAWYCCRKLKRDIRQRIATFEERAEQDNHHDRPPAYENAGNLRNQFELQHMARPELEFHDEEESPIQERRIAQNNAPVSSMRLGRLIDEPHRPRAGSTIRRTDSQWEVSRQPRRPAASNRSLHRSRSLDRSSMRSRSQHSVAFSEDTLGRRDRQQRQQQQQPTSRDSSPESRRDYLPQAHAGQPSSSGQRHTQRQEAHQQDYPTQERIYSGTPYPFQQVNEQRARPQDGERGRQTMTRFQPPTYRDEEY
jgi:hypothetical protein